MRILRKHTPESAEKLIKSIKKRAYLEDMPQKIIGATDRIHNMFTALELLYDYKYYIIDNKEINRYN